MLMMGEVIYLWVYEKYLFLSKTMYLHIYIYYLHLYLQELKNLEVKKRKESKMTLRCLVCVTVYTGMKQR